MIGLGGGSHTISRGVAPRNLEMADYGMVRRRSYMRSLLILSDTVDLGEKLKLLVKFVYKTGHPLSFCYPFEPFSPLSLSQTRILSYIYYTVKSSLYLNQYVFNRKYSSN